MQAGDFQNALHYFFRLIAAIVQLKGLDNAEAVQCHLQLASVYNEIGDQSASTQHLWAAKYCLELIGGPMHPEIQSTMIKLATIYIDLKQFDLSVRCLEFSSSRGRSSDLGKQGNMSHLLAEAFFHLERYKEASEAQLQYYRRLFQLLGPNDKITIEAKSRYEQMKRKQTELVVMQARQKQAEQEAEMERKLADDWIEDSNEGIYTPGAGGSKKKKAKGKGGRKK